MAAARIAVLLLCSLLLVACGKEPPRTGAPAPTRPEVPPAGTSPTGLTGRITFRGAPPPEETVEVTDEALALECPGGVVRLEWLLVAPDGGIANVLVWVKAPPPAGDQIPSEPALLTTVKGRFEPHLLALRSGQKLKISNQDAARHNPHFTTESLLLPHAAGLGEVPGPGESVIRGPVRPAQPPRFVRCDVHGWMRGWIAVFDHPWFAVTAADGTYRIPGLPDGEHEVRFWHEKLGERRLRVQVVGGNARADLELGE